MRQEILFNDNWFFVEVPPDSADSDSIQGASFRPCEIPHDFLIDDSRTFYRDADGWYRRMLTYHYQQAANVYICFDGVYMDSSLYCNGEHVGDWKYGYTAFHFDLTPFLREGENELLLCCRHRVPNSRWYSGAGVYRNVRLLSVDSSHFLPGGIYIHSEKADSEFLVTVHAETSVCGGTISHTITDVDGLVVAEGHGGNQQEITISEPRLWSNDSPHLYTVTSRLFVEGKETDCVSVRFGLRTLLFDPQNGFFLNDNHMKLNGVCLHHDLGALGAATNTVAIRKRLQCMMDMGVNAVRLSHNPVSQDFMDLCDEMGILVLSELLDMWKKPKTEYDYARFFEDWVEKDVESWIRRDRNHPCVILWSVGNEIYDTHVSPAGLQTLIRLVELVSSHDPLGNARVTLCSNYMPWENTQLCADFIKLIGYNYGEKCYEEHHKEHPDWILYGSETASMVQSRGIYHFPLSVSILSDDDFQCSSLGNSRTSWGASSAEQCILTEKETPFSLGQFLWSGYDYIGEPTPYHSKNSFFGMVDTAGFPKDVYYIFKAAWTDLRDEPVLHLFPYWDFSEGQLIDVRAATNAPQVELFLNKESQGTRHLPDDNGKKLLGEWRVPFTAGFIEAVAYDDLGRVVARSRRDSFGDSARIRLIPDQPTLKADGQDLLYLTISTEDRLGRPVENATNRVSVTVEGAARLVGLDNGNSTNYDSYKGSSMRLFSGKLSAILASKTTAGPIDVTVSSAGLPDAKLKLLATPSVSEPGICASSQNTLSIADDPADIPVRKIQLAADRLVLDAENRSTEVTYAILPQNASDRDVIFRVTDLHGIDTRLAYFDKLADGRVRVTARGDGEFALRCASKSGGPLISLYSVLFFCASGLGQAFLDPYGYINGGQYAFSGGEIGNGNERGFASARTGRSYAGFRDIDFGSFGSDKLTIDVFCLDSDPLPIELWEGTPDGADGTLLETLLYQKQSVWNTYQPETYTLSKRLSAVKTLSLLLPRKTHIRGFSFAHQEKAFSLLYAGECDAITGDSFRRTEREVTDIGNNVTLLFENMDFGTTGAVIIRVSGRTNLPQNTIQLRFRDVMDPSAEDICAIEFHGQNSEEFVEQEFLIPSVFGRKDVAFVFLPGSQFDFSSFYFVPAGDGF